MSIAEENKKIEIIKDVNLKKIISEWIVAHPKSQILNHKYNKLDVELVAVNGKDAIYLFGGSYNSFMFAPKITFSLIGPGHLHIDDINAKHNNVGNGSILMEALLQYSHNNKIQIITGDLSSIDDDHRDRMEHYYSKFGFLVSSNSILLEVINS